MAVANPCHKKEWEDWKREMEENRRRRWRQRLSRHVTVEVSDEEEGEGDEGEEEEAQGSEEEEEDESKDEEIDEERVDVSEVAGLDGEGEDVLEREIVENRTEEEEETNESADNEEEDEENNEEREVKEDEQVDAEEDNEVLEAEEVEEEQKEVENDVGGEVEENREMDQEEEDWGEENEPEGGVSVREEEQVEEEEQDQEEEHGEENESEGDVSVGEEEQVEEEEDEEEEEEEEELLEDANGIVGAVTSQEREEEEDETEKLTFKEEMVADFRDDHKNLLEEEQESTDDEGAECSADEDVDSDDEDVVKIYSKDDYLTDLFGTLAEFRDSSLLTDLTLSTEDGHSFHVHSPVLAAVSSLIRESLRRRDARREEDERKAGVQLYLGPEVDRVGLEAVVEFAYTGLAPGLNQYTVHQVRAAAQTLGSPRVLDLCTEEEEKSTKAGGQKTEEKISAAEQMSTSLRSIEQLWIDKVGCDVILDALRGPIHVHRVILAVCSDYFRSMFTLGMKESRQTIVTLPFLMASELEVLIHGSYSGTLPLSWSCVFELTSTALQLQFQPALALCLKFLHQEINRHSCLDVASFAEAYEMAQLLEAADDFVLRQFQKVWCTSKFKDLPAKQLMKYLNSQSLCVPSELVVFKAVVAWIQAKPKRRLRLAKELMKTIHFPLMTFKEFKEVQSLNIWSDHSLAELFEAIFEDFCSNEIAAQSKCRIYLPKESLILTGGDHTTEDLSSRNVSHELWFGNSLRNHMGIKKAMEWRRLGEMPDGQSRYRHEVAVIEGQLYLFGGKRYYGTSDTLNSVYRYDPCQNSWQALAAMHQRRYSFSVVVLDGKIYAIGGHCDPDYIESVERYCPVANSWRFTCPLDLPLSAHTAKVLHGQIFVCGGLSSRYQCLASMFRYHPETGSTYLANMAKPRAHHCMETLGDFLYVAGGITTDDNCAFFDQLACEVYDPAADSWTEFTPLQVPHVGAGSALLEGKFYVLGGYSQEDDSDTKMVHRYDPATQRWENMGKMPGPNNDLRACVLPLPPHFRQ